jgi:hypothetical protein
MTNLVTCSEPGCRTLVPDTPDNLCGSPSLEGYIGEPSDEGCDQPFCGEHLWATYADGNLCADDYDRVGDRVAAEDANGADS